MQSNKVTATIARALAELSLTRIGVIKNRLLESDKEKALRSIEVQRLRALYRERSKLDQQIRKALTKANKKFNVSITVYNDRSINVSRYTKDKLPPVEELKNEIII